MTAPDAGYDARAQRLAIALRDHADAVRALPDVEAMRARLVALVVEDAAAAPDGGVDGAGPTGRRLAAPRHVVALACSALLLGGAGFAFASGDAPESSAAGPVAAMRTGPGPVPADAGPATPDPVIAAPPAPSSTSVSTVTGRSAVAEVRPATDVPAGGGNELAPVPPTAPPAPDAPTPTAAPTTGRVTTTPRPTTTKPVATTTTLVRFTMVQKWRTSSATPPFEELSGTADPGTTITVTSAYGSGTTTVDPTGRWAIRVAFPTAPVGTAFTGRVRTATQGTKSFTFTRLPATP